MRSFAAPKHRIRREVVLLFIYRLYIFYITLHASHIISEYIIFEFYLSPPCLRNTDLKHDLTALSSIDLSGVPDLSCYVLKQKHSFLIYLVPQYLLILFYLNSVNFILFFHYLTSRCMPSLLTFLFICANKLYFHNCLFLILN